MNAKHQTFRWLIAANADAWPCNFYPVSFSLATPANDPKWSDQ